MEHRNADDFAIRVVAVLFSSAEVAGLAVMSLKRLVVYETTLAYTATKRDFTECWNV